MTQFINKNFQALQIIVFILGIASAYAVTRATVEVRLARCEKAQEHIEVIMFEDHAMLKEMYGAYQRGCSVYK